ncbi:ABC transporter ATP-binding protein [Asaccharospora irregularis]|uniref:NitT/TauT family transport system ATP-binding protein n=1 Tax=Asaccharospora irregularis DSM 2635 TaxID=1121321 RepID=A0A1M5P045_9FIRM|nr:ATP-binding cassette domain-containing protein [Asaccharospora irregularis]SHG95141.1 NitT/TauT family transport system ATP-binding protein [Asaccharospora irregularis DSM 2635]
MEEMTFNIKNINKTYGNKVIFRDFEIDFYRDKVNCIIGKSGCGKTTLLNIISGVIKSDIEDFETLERFKLSYIFQEDRLIQWLTVEENIKLIGKKYYDESVIDSVCDKYLELVGIGEYKKYYPQMLSGGIRQRVNIARAFICPSKVIIMDEPFKSIDAKNKKMIIERLKEIFKKEKRTAIFVTHDIEEALLLADKIFILGDSPVNIKDILDNNKNLEKNSLYSLI